MTRYFKSSIFVLALIMIALCAFSNGFAQDAKKAEKAKLLTEENKKKIEAVLDKHIAEVKTPAAILGVWTPDGEQVIVRGKSDVKTGTDAKTTDKFRIASLTKTFTATLFLMLVDEKKLSLDDKLSKFFPEVKNSGKITVRQLLNHTSGLYSYTSLDEFNKFVITEPLKKWSTTDLLKIAADNKPDFDPGTSYRYSNTNYLLAGMIIEKLTGEKFADVLKKKICEPLGLKDTYYAVTPEIEGSHFHGYNDTVDVSIFEPSGPNFAGAVVSTIGDLKIWAAAIAEGKLISKELQNERLKLVSEEKNLEMGYGLGIMSFGTFLGHNGSINGYCIAMFHHPDPAVTIICMMPMSIQFVKGAPEKVFNEVAELLLPGQVHQKVKADKIIK